jgi:hypothetical protein
MSERESSGMLHDARPTQRALDAAPGGFLRQLVLGRRISVSGETTNDPHQNGESRSCHRSLWYEPF